MRFIVLFVAVSLLAACPKPPDTGIANQDLRDAMLICSANLGSSREVALKGEIEKRGAGLKYSDASEMLSGVFEKDEGMTAEDRQKRIDSYMTCLDNRLGKTEEKKSGLSQP